MFFFLRYATSQASAFSPRYLFLSHAFSRFLIGLFSWHPRQIGGLVQPALPLLLEDQSRLLSQRGGPPLPAFRLFTMAYNGNATPLRELSQRTLERNMAALLLLILLYIGAQLEKERGPVLILSSEGSCIILRCAGKRQQIHAFDLRR